MKWDVWRTRHSLGLFFELVCFVFFLTQPQGAQNIQWLCVVVCFGLCWEKIGGFKIGNVVVFVGFFSFFSFLSFLLLFPSLFVLSFFPCSFVCLFVQSSSLLLFLLLFSHLC